MWANGCKMASLIISLINALSKESRSGVFIVLGKIVLLTFYFHKQGVPFFFLKYFLIMVTFNAYRLKVRGWENIFHANGKQKNAGSSNSHIRQNRP